MPEVSKIDHYDEPIPLPALDSPLLPGEILRTFRQYADKTLEVFAELTGYTDEDTGTPIVQWSKDYLDRIENGEKAFSELDYYIWRTTWDGEDNFDMWDKAMVLGIEYQETLLPSQRKHLIVERRKCLANMVMEHNKALKQKRKQIEKGLQAKLSKTYINESHIFQRLREESAKGDR